MLLDASKELIGFQFILAGRRPAQQANVQHDDVAAARLQPIQDIAQMIQIVVIADRNKDIAWPGTDSLRGEFAFLFEVELIHLHMSSASCSAVPLGNCEYDIEKNGKRSAGHGGDGLGEQVDDRDQEQRQGDQTESDGNLHSADIKVQRNLEFPLAGFGVAENKDR